MWMMPIFTSPKFSSMYWALREPWLESVKQTWNTLSLPSMTSSPEAEGVMVNTRSS